MLRCRQAICRGCRIKTTLGTAPITKLWFTSSDKAVSKALDPEVVFSHSQATACPAAEDAYTDTIRWNCASSKQLFLSHATPGREGSRQVPCWHHQPSGSTRAAARPSTAKPTHSSHSPTHLTLCFPGNTASELLRFLVTMASKLSFHTKQGSFITAVYSHISHLCSCG